MKIDEDLVQSIPWDIKIWVHGDEVVEIPIPTTQEEVIRLFSTYSELQKKVERIALLYGKDELNKIVTEGPSKDVDYYGGWSFKQILSISKHVINVELISHCKVWCDRYYEDMYTTEIEFPTEYLWTQNIEDSIVRAQQIEEARIAELIEQQEKERLEKERLAKEKQKQEAIEREKAELIRLLKKYPKIK